MEKLLAGVDAAAAALSPGGGPAAAGAIHTTDAGPKTYVVHGDGFTVGGMA
jgi:glutamate N-acetyltransferase/amino-acid N-acetyltransferase